MHVVVDDRERDGQVAGHFAALPEVNVEIGHLALGDFLVDGRLIVERKTVADLAVSLCDGRLFRQARRLAADRGHRVCIVLEGTSRDAERVGVTRESLQGAVVSLTLVYGLPLLRARDAAETARLIRYAAAQLVRSGAGLPKRVLRKTTAAERVSIEMLQAIPGIGPERARALLLRFGSVAALAAAPHRELVTVPRVGRTLAVRVLAALGSTGPGAEDQLVPARRRSRSSPVSSLPRRPVAGS
jgi:DNA excision repair protein ERCC-4